MQLDKSSFKSLIGLATFTILLFWGLQNNARVVRGIGFVLELFSPIIIGACIAFILNLPMSFIEDKLLKSLKGKAAGLKRPLGVVLSLCFVLGLLCVVLFLIIPELARTFILLAGIIPEYLDQFNLWLTELAMRIPELESWIEAITVDWDAVFAAVLNFLQNDALIFLNSTMGAVAGIFSGLLKAFLGFVFSLYILLQKEELGRQGRSIIYAYCKPETAQRTLEVCKLTHKSFHSFITGQCAEAVVLGLMFFVSMTLFQLPYALMISVLIGFTALIPIFGAFIGCAVGVFLIVMVAPLKALWFLILFLVLQQVEGNLIYPRVVGNSVGLPSIWVLLAVTVGGSTMGIVGMLIFIPLCSVFYALLQQSVATRLKLKGLKPDKL